MRLATFEASQGPRLGAIVDERVIDLGAAASALGGRTAVPADMLAFLRAGNEAMAAARTILAAIDTGGTNVYTHKRSDVRLCAPIAAPPKILCIGQNYRDHVLEQNAAMPKRPIVFAKFSTTVIGPGDNIIYPTTTNALDYEAELVVVIGKVGKHISREAAYEHVAGYMVGQDVTARDLQSGDGQWVRGKSQDTFAPLGPYLTTRDEILDPHTLAIKLWVKDEVRQDSNTRNLIFDVPTLIAFISEGITLTPGDLIYTGTPPGVGAFRKPVPGLLKVGDTVTVEIERLGSIANQVVADTYSARG